MLISQFGSVPELCVVRSVLFDS